MMSVQNEAKLRSRAKRQGYKLLKSRKKLGLNNAGQYQLIDAKTNTVVLGSDFDADLDAIARFLLSQTE